MLFRVQGDFLHLFNEIVICFLNGRVPQNILQEIGGVLLQEHLVSLFEYYHHVVVQILVQGHRFVMLVLRIVYAHVTRERRGVVVEGLTAAPIAPTSVGLR